MSGFFGLGLAVGAQKTSPAPKRGSLLSGCDGCKRIPECQHPKMELVGDGSRTGIMVIVEQPTKSDDRKGQLLSGDAGRILYSAFKAAGIDLVDVWVVPAVRCGGGEEAKAKHAEFCRQYLFSDIQKLNPKVIIPLGPIATQGLLGDRIRGRLSGTKPTAWIGERIPDQETKRWVCPSFSLPFVLSNDRERDIKDLFYQHIQGAVGALEAPWPVPPESIQLCFSPADAIAVLRTVKSQAAWFAFDYETTGLKPQAAGHEIVCASVGWKRMDGSLFAASFPFFRDRAFRLMWRALLLDPRCGKVAHNNPFEATWTYHRASLEDMDPYWPIGWVGDTQAASHFENSHRPNGLKFRIFAKLGILGYDDGIDKYLKAEGSNGINRIREIALKDLLTYNAKDSLYTAWLQDQCPPDEFGFQGMAHYGLRLLIDGQATFAKLHTNGLPLDTYESEQAIQRVTGQMASLHSRIMDCEEARMMPRGFNFESPQQLSQLLYDKLDYKGVTGSASTDEDALLAIGTPFTKSILEHRKLGKIKSTYLEGFSNESVNGIVHPFFNLTKVVTFRSSSNAPNFQNIPKRDKSAQKLVRSCFRPSPGNVFIEYDYGQIEVRISACYHKDPTMLKYIEDPTTDMHRDIGMQLFCRTKETLTKGERGLAKNGYVFPSFYGSSWKVTAPAMWEELSEDAKDNLAAHKIRSLPGFEKHVKEIEDDFWGRRFRRYADWKKEIWKSYQRNGYVELLSGFRVPGPMEFTDATNYQIQGAAFHCMLYTLNQIVDKIEAISGRSKVVGQIHDAMVVDAHPEDVPMIDKLLWFYGTQEIRNVYPWIIVPLIIEKEISEVDGTWARMTGSGVLTA